MDGRPNHRKQPAFSNSSGLMQTLGPEKYYFSSNVEGKYKGKDNLTINATHSSGANIGNVLPIRRY